jgi:hypothetical protein
MRHPRAQADPRQQLGRSASRFLLGLPPDTQWHHNVLESGKLAQQVMELKDESDGSIAQLTELGLVSTVHRLASDYYIPARRFV